MPPILWSGIQVSPASAGRLVSKGPVSYYPSGYVQVFVLQLVFCRTPSPTEILGQNDQDYLGTSSTFPNPSGRNMNAIIADGRRMDGIPSSNGRYSINEERNKKGRWRQAMAVCPKRPACDSPLHEAFILDVLNGMKIIAESFEDRLEAQHKAQP